MEPDENTHFMVLNEKRLYLIETDRDGERTICHTFDTSQIKNITVIPESTFDATHDHDTTRKKQTNGEVVVIFFKKQEPNNPNQSN